MSRFIGLIGIVAILAIAAIFSENRKKINWRLVATGLGLQVIFALIILKVPAGRTFFEFCSKAITKLLDFTKEGSSFLFGSLLDQNTFGSIFALQVLPTIIFFSALMGILYYLGIMQFIVKIIAKFICKLLGTSGAETLSAVGNIFLGQTEAPLLVKPFIKDMTRSELMAIMVGGMATVAGGVMAGYVAMGVNAGDLLAASIMAAPAGLILAKILVPETEEPKTKNTTDIQIEQTASNVVEAAANGASEGLGLALNVAAMLLAFVALIALLNYILAAIGGLFGFPTLSFQWILGKIFSPLTFAMGIPTSDISTAGSLLGQKIMINEFVAYSELSKFIAAGTLQPKTILILTYALCGFANISSVAIQIGGIGALAPDKKGVIAKLGFKALLGGALATCLTGTIAGVLFSI
ncbi:MAG: NupC/NupG family nucleoside CNT transporter [Clostridium baratii]|uniref:Nucleoside permease n=1 Tax=Clostridium baratii str. Sullivan TaxID=1415775 RepID=A0A0A7FZA0_9CLOT|nr:NupC/NupG family nucleoside CNT transporter [Clostridium baratii]AIY84923.1 nucleoside transporter, NupC family protein [Clostridium baratii str. Sullivan]MBS6007878.1 NupC/NupG family nucleoside CNT transporter [Clostridium baratii]MDU1054673.1 NupC/NupG family nucleoside CNT transporter [Clostridium baratii]MDU4911464.1 NupC/NupG family nucleoside CNT transporter [Clostridium baratii]CUP74967.1 nucleoside transporter [Clostridium baratii]